MNMKQRTPQEQELIDMFRTLTPYEKALTIEYARAVLHDQEKAEAMEEDLRQRIAAAEGQRQRLGHDPRQRET